ncbi:MAG TPA: YkgJ family cysteine cluster protein [Myxococcota bacterium]|nr:YkgJ family cysteine cluster protein [Myxococcota bacterium]
MADESEVVAARLAAWGREARGVFAAAREPARLAAAVVTFHRRVDEAIDASLRGHGVAVACAKGCGYCCSLRVEVQPYEAFRLADWLRRHFDAARLAGVVARLRANVERTRALGKEARKRSNLPCALLGADGACTAYEARPAQCRRYHSTDLAPCKAFHADPAREEIESAMHPAVAHNADVIITQARHAVRAAGLREESEDMNFALLAALENPKAWRRWKDGKAPFPDTPRQGS